MYNKIRTLCKGCCFSTYDDDGCQDGCAVGRLKQWQEKGKVQSLEDGTCAIHDYCNTARHPKWLEKYGPDFYQQLDDETFPKVDVIVPILDEDNVEEIAKTFNSISQERFNKIIIPFHSHSIRVKDVLNTICGLTFGKNTQFEINDECSKTQQLPEVINTAVERSDATFYTVLAPGKLFSKGLLDSLDIYINLGLNKVVLIEGDEENPQLIHRLAHVQCGGNKVDYTSIDSDVNHVYYNLVFDTIMERIVEDGQQYLIAKWSDVCKHK